MDLLSEQYIKAFDECRNIYNQEMDTFCSGLEQRLTDESFKHNLKYTIRKVVIYHLNHIFKLNNHLSLSNDDDCLRPFLLEGNFNIDEMVSFLINIYPIIILTNLACTKFH